MLLLLPTDLQVQRKTDVARTDCSRWNLLRVFTSFEAGAHTALPSVEYYKASAFKIVPENGRYDVSGEMAPLTDLKGTVIQNVLQVL